MLFDGKHNRIMTKVVAIIAIVGLGQLLVVQQGGFDLSLPGAVSLAVVVATHYPQQDDALLWQAVHWALKTSSPDFSSRFASLISTTPTFWMRAATASGALDEPAAGWLALVT